MMVLAPHDKALGMEDARREKDRRLDIQAGKPPPPEGDRPPKLAPNGPKAPEDTGSTGLSENFLGAVFRTQGFKEVLNFQTSRQGGIGER